MSAPRLGLFVMLAIALTACKHEFEPPDRAQQVRDAEEAFSDQLFDSVAWASQDARVQEGNAIYAEFCRRCHGQLGRGQTAYALERRLEVPSLVEPDWDLDDLAELRHAVFVGHETGMPGFGRRRLTPLQMDAVAGYILDVLRPEVLGDP